MSESGEREEGGYRVMWAHTGGTGNAYCETRAEANALADRCLTEGCWSVVINRVQELATGVGCPKCGAAGGEPCRTSLGAVRRDLPHVMRQKRADAHVERRL